MFFHVLLILCTARAAQPRYAVDPRGDLALLRSESKPQPRLAKCAGEKLECGSADVDPCVGTECKGHHACMGTGYRNCEVKLQGPTGASSRIPLSHNEHQVRKDRPGGMFACQDLCVRRTWRAAYLLVRAPDPALLLIARACRRELSALGPMSSLTLGR